MNVEDYQREKAEFFAEKKKSMTAEQFQNLKSQSMVDFEKLKSAVMGQDTHSLKQLFQNSTLARCDFVFACRLASGQAKLTLELLLAGF